MSIAKVTLVKCAHEHAHYQSNCTVGVAETLFVTRCTWSNVVLQNDTSLFNKSRSVFFRMSDLVFRDRSLFIAWGLAEDFRLKTVKFS